MSQKDHVFYRSQRKELPLIERGEGIYLYTQDGKRFIDGTSGALISNIGHSQSSVIDAMDKQAREIEFVHGTMFKSDASIALADRVIKMCPDGLEKVYFVSGGTEAVETALKMARSYHLARGNLQKYVVLSRWQSYHGATMGALSLSGRTASRKMYQPYLLDFPHIPPAYCYRCPYGKNLEDCGYECAWELEKTIHQIGEEFISAFIAEPVVGATLCSVPAPPDYFSIIREICDKHDVLFIADEVMTSFGRTGKNFGMDHWGVVPDILVGGKGLGAGYFPMGMIICTDRVFQQFQEKLGKFVHGFTYQGNPLGAAAASAVLQFIHSNDLVHYVSETGKYLLDKLLGLYRYEFVGDIRGLGFMLGVELVKDAETKKPYPVELGLTNNIVKAAWDKGLIIYPSSSNGQIEGVAGDGFMVAPPFITTKDQIDEIVAILEDTMDDVKSDLKL